MRNPFSQWTRNWLLLLGAVFSTGIFFGVQLTLYNNFIVERLHIEAQQLGFVEGLRELPGFLNALFIALLIRIAPPLVGAAALVVMGLGIMAYSQLSSVFMLAVYSLVWSLGFHCWAPLEQTLGLAYSPPGDKGRWLGQMRSASSLAWLLAIGACMLLYPLLHYGGLFVMAGAATVVGGLALLLTDRRRTTIVERGLVFRRRYLLFYVLQALQGCRKQVFITFAIFALVKVHGMPVQTAMLLSLVNQGFVFLTGPLMGRLVDRLGERVTLSVSHFVLIFVFLGYAFVEDRTTLYVLYCVDSGIFFGAIALTTYLHKIAPAEDVKPTLAMGVTMNHLSSVVAPIAGGFVWHYFGYQVIFVSGAVLSLVSLIASQRVDPAGLLAREARLAADGAQAVAPAAT